MHFDDNKSRPRHPPATSGEYTTTWCFGITSIEKMKNWMVFGIAVFAALLRSGSAFVPLAPPVPQTRCREALSHHHMQQQVTDDDDDSSVLNSATSGHHERRAFVQHSLLAGLAFGMASWPVKQAVAADDEATVTLHIVDYPKAGACGEVQTTEQKAFFAKKFGGLQDGSCSVEDIRSTQERPMDSMIRTRKRCTRSMEKNRNRLDRDFYANGSTDQPPSLTAHTIEYKHSNGYSSNGYT